LRCCCLDATPLLILLLLLLLPFLSLLLLLLSLQVTEALLRVMHLIDEATELTTPHMLGKVVRHKLTARFRRLWGSLRSGGSSSTADEGSAAAGANARAWRA
jgi:hypothetical protein